MCRFGTVHRIPQKSPVFNPSANENFYEIGLQECTHSCLEEDKMAFCVNCGEKISDEAKFCSKCGTAVAKTDENNQNQLRLSLEGESQECPNCGEIISSFESKCRACGFELQNLQTSDAVQELADTIANIEAARGLKKDSTATAFLKRFNLVKEEEINATDKSIANVIRSYIIPNTKEDAFEFMTLAAANIDIHVLRKSANTPEEKSRKYITEAWKAKFDQVYQKAKIVFGDNPDFYKIESIYFEKENEIRAIEEKELKERRKSWILLIAMAAVPLLLLCLGGIFSFLGRTSTPNGIHPPISASEIKGKNCEAVVRQFRSAGFTNVSTERIEDLITGWLTKDGEIEQIAIEGETDFKKWDSFRADAKVVVSYHTFSRGKTTTYESSGSSQAGAKTDANNSKTGLPNNDVQTDKSVSYSTNDRETAKNGNSGVFAYKNIGGTYDIYWIIDFDEGYVYYFTDGNGGASCHRLKIDSGDLNSVLIITYHDGDDVWSYGLHFNWKNQPDTLILQDNNGFETKFMTTDLSKALEIRDSKTIIDY